MVFEVAEDDFASVFLAFCLASRSEKWPTTWNGARPRVPRSR